LALLGGGGGRGESYALAQGKIIKINTTEELIESQGRGRFLKVCRRIRAGRENNRGRSSDSEGMAASSEGWKGNTPEIERESRTKRRRGIDREKLV